MKKRDDLRLVVSSATLDAEVSIECFEVQFTCFSCLNHILRLTLTEMIPVRIRQLSWVLKEGHMTLRFITLNCENLILLLTVTLLFPSLPLLLNFSLFLSLSSSPPSLSPLSHPTSPVADYVKCTVDTALAIHREQPAGDILAFLTGQVRI